LATAIMSGVSASLPTNASACVQKVIAAWCWPKFDDSQLPIPARVVGFADRLAATRNSCE
jgi:hypothetical protein